MFGYNVVSAEIGSSFNSILNLIFDLISYCFAQLDAITIGGVSLLSIAVTLLILSAVIPILFTIASSGVGYSHNYAINERNNSYRTYAKNRSRNESYDAKYRKGS